MTIGAYPAERGWRRSWSGGARRGAGPYVSEMGERVGANRSRLLDMLAQFDRLAARIRDEAELVITHGEPHVANVVHAESGVVLIDWDTVRRRRGNGICGGCRGRAGGNIRG